jgi:hypothetical protein
MSCRVPWPLPSLQRIVPCEWTALPPLTATSSYALPLEILPLSRLRVCSDSGTRGTGNAQNLGIKLQILAAETCSVKVWKRATNDSLNGEATCRRRG